MAALFKRDRSPFWWVTWTTSGKKFRESTGVRHYERKTPCESAKAIMRSIEDKMARQRFGLEVMFQAAPIKEFLASYSLTLSGREATITSAQGALDRLEEWAEEKGIRFMHELDRSAACDFVASRIADGVKVSSVKVQNTILATALNEAKRRGLVKFEENPFQMKLKTDSVDPKPFSREEIQAMFSMTQAPKWIHTAMRICLSTGARIGSVLALQWEDVDFTSGAILFRVSKKGRYTVPASNELIAYLLPLKKDVGTLFPEVAGKSSTLPATLFTRSVQRECGFHAHWHRFRHTWVTAMQASGVPIRVAMTLADHSSESIHEGYAHSKAIEMRSYVKDLSLFPKTA